MTGVLLVGLFLVSAAIATSGCNGKIDGWYFCRTKVYTRLDNTKCHESYKRCFNTAEKAAEFVAHAAKHGQVDPKLAVEKVSGPVIRPRACLQVC